MWLKFSYNFPTVFEYLLGNIINDQFHNLHLQPNKIKSSVCEIKSTASLTCMHPTKIT